MVENSVGSVFWVIHRNMIVMWPSCTFLPAAETKMLTQVMTDDRRNGPDSSGTAEKS